MNFRNISLKNLVFSNGFLFIFAILNLGSSSSLSSSSFDALLDELEENIEMRENFLSPAKGQEKEFEKLSENQLEFKEKKISGRTAEENLLLDLSSEMSEIESSIDQLSDEINKYRYSLLEKSQITNQIEIAISLGEGASSEKLDVFMDEIPIFSGTMPWLGQESSNKILVYSGPVYPGSHQVKVVKTPQMKVSDSGEKLEEKKISKDFNIEIPHKRLKKTFNLSFDVPKKD